MTFATLDMEKAVSGEIYPLLKYPAVVSVMCVRPSHAASESLQIETPPATGLGGGAGVDDVSPVELDADTVVTVVVGQQRFL